MPGGDLRTTRQADILLAMHAEPAFPSSFHSANVAGKSLFPSIAPDIVVVGLVHAVLVLAQWRSILLQRTVSSFFSDSPVDSFMVSAAYRVLHTRCALLGVYRTHDGLYLMRIVDFAPLVLDAFLERRSRAVLCHISFCNKWQKKKASSSSSGLPLLLGDGSRTHFCQPFVFAGLRGHR